MTAFVVISALLVVAALLFVATPLIRRRGGTVDQAGVDAVALTRQRQLEELEQELEDGQIDNRTYELSRREIESEASNSQAQVESGPARTTGTPVSAIVLAIVIPLLTAAIYLQVGEWEAIEREPMSMDDMDMEQAIHQLEQRLQSHPDDLEGWMMLGRTRLALGEYEAAVEAYRQALDLAGDDNARALANYAEAVSLADPGRMLTEAAPLFRRVLELEPAQPKGLWYSGLIAFEERDYASARDHWQRLLEQDPPPGFREIVEERLSAARRALGDRPGTEAESSAHVMVRVSVSDDLAATLTPDDVVFIIARAADEAAGPPLAGIRLPISALPGEFRLGDENAMLDGYRISGHEQIEIIARVSRSGEATPRDGDLLGREIIRVEAHSEDAAIIVIDEVL
ncbi:c-type cytochrome biogenesis protein CcmI [Natronospira bacteriovora]|uniref:C-type cytochrome biogenesis protein CcmI n=1 Tax=Natronospira bacteriovora TaxID=3069753 RepID=A0ABU0W9P2_9GAMM|nr:c-type cytochrome biogenesis protein CcmI [Natronospira sp. AB-CW4]MDQ2070743.1 c-type cytochrome biogenesis protein CcmI [Natronospira sp. AB-CW4]